MIAFIIKQPIRTIYLNQHYGPDFIESRLGRTLESRQNPADGPINTKQTPELRMLMHLLLRGLFLLHHRKP